MLVLLEHKELQGLLEEAEFKECRDQVEHLDPLDQLVQLVLLDLQAVKDFQVLLGP